MLRLFFLGVFLAWSSWASAQNLPRQASTTLNDFAALLTPSEAAELEDELRQLQRHHGVQLTLLTLPDQGGYAPDLTLEQFARQVFDHWGIGVRQRNTGVLIMILRDDRSMRIELGAAYGRAWDRAAARIIDDHFMAAFSKENYRQGIFQGVQATIDEIILPNLDGNTRPAPQPVKTFPWIFVALIAAFGLYMIKDCISDGLLWLQHCSSCHKRGGLRQKRKVLRIATPANPGKGTRMVRCKHCDHRYHKDYVISFRRYGIGHKAESCGTPGGDSTSGGGGAS